VTVNSNFNSISKPSESTATSNRPSITHNRTRVNSGAPFLRAHVGSIASSRPSSSQAIEIKNKARNTSVCSN
jgi:hypothetical protein